MLPSDPASPDPERGLGQPPDFSVGPTPIGQPAAPHPSSSSAPGSRATILALAMVIVSVLAGGALFVSGFLVGQRFADQPGTPVTSEKQFQPFWDSYHEIVNRYAGGEVDQQALIRGAIKGMVDALDDPHSGYLTPDEYRQGLQDLSGSFEGIGAEIVPRPLYPNAVSAAITSVSTSPATTTPPSINSAPILSFSVTTIFSAVFLPTPFTRLNTSACSFTTARRRTSGESEESTESANLGPTPCTVSNKSNKPRCSSVAKPNNVSESSRTINCVCKNITRPTSTPSSTDVGTNTLKPTPPTSITQVSGC